MFIASLVGDIVRGMIYIQESPLRFHANLKTSNCLVDSRWVLKISDFGLQDFHIPMTNVDDCLAGRIPLDPTTCQDLLYR
jgi:hypothetical protein